MTKATGQLKRTMIGLLGLVLFTACSKSLREEQPVATLASYSGSSQCKSCHLAFYKKWSTSHHGTAMQPFTPGFAGQHLTSQKTPIQVGTNQYQVRLGTGEGFVEERGPKGNRRFPIVHVMGGKNVYYLLTPFDRGRLQVLPLAYDVNEKRWYDAAASGVRMHVDRPPETPLDWTDPAFTFNTSCYGCHVSQMRVNYDLSTDTYHTTWTEPGINCESCHGPGDAHLALFKNPPAKRPDNIGILKITALSPAERNEVCAGCHAKMSPLSPGYEPRQRFFDHYDLVTLESDDFYPDGRDLGENYTYTGWMMSSCVRDANFDCIHCHTSSGRYKFASENVNGACLPCHQDKAANIQAHSHHRPDGAAGSCIACHMPKTRFAAMNRTDHSMLPPTPAATIRFKSPNACNLCHRDKDARWADSYARKWHPNEYQKPVLARAGLIDAARKHDWAQLPAMLAVVGDRNANTIFRVSLIRLLGACSDRRKIPVLITAARDPLPLVRAAAAESLQGEPSAAARETLAAATADGYRLVRLRAAAALRSVRLEELPQAQRGPVAKARAELVAALQARPDDFAAQSNLGNYYLDSGDIAAALRSFETAIKLRPDAVGTLVNASIAYSRAGRGGDADRVLAKALEVQPANGPANFNRGLLLAEQGRKPEAESHLRTAASVQDTAGPASFNLCVLLAAERPAEALPLCARAVKVEPANEKYVYTFAYFLAQSGQRVEARRLLATFAATHQPGYDSQMLLADLYAGEGKAVQAASVYRGLLRQGLDDSRRAAVESRLQKVSGLPR